MSNQEQLSTVVAAFEQWRNNRNGRQLTTPEHLRQQAVSLLEHCSSSAITRALRISGSQLKQWRERSTPRNTEFISLPWVDGSSAPQQRLELSLHNGVQLSLSGALSSSLIVDILREAKS
jgi:hypothetical protein